MTICNFLSAEDFVVDNEEVTWRKKLRQKNGSPCGLMLADGIPSVGLPTRMTLPWHDVNIMPAWRDISMKTSGFLPDSGAFREAATGRSERRIRLHIKEKGDFPEALLGEAVPDCQVLQKKIFHNNHSATDLL